MRHVVVVLATVLVAVAALAADPAPAPAKAPKATAELLAKGRATYETMCASCHGTLGDGMGPAGQFLNPKPRHFGKDALKQGESVSALFATLQTGVAGTPMVAFAHLPEDDRWAISWYVAHWLGTKEGKQAKKIVEKLPAASSSTAAPPAAAPTPSAP